jgi:hypothetical protein
MLTFYPEFEVDNITDNEIILLLDLSNSMKVCMILCTIVPSVRNLHQQGICYTIYVEIFCWIKTCHVQLHL